MSLVKAKSDFKGESEEELTLLKGQVIIVLEGDQNGWSKGEVNGKRGWFPTAYVELLEDETKPAPASVPQSIAPPVLHPVAPPVAIPKKAVADPTCDICKKAIEEDSVRWNLRLYHQSCLRCTKCFVPLESPSIIKKVGTDPHCNKCFDELMFGAPKAVAQPPAVQAAVAAPKIPMKKLPTNPALVAMAKASGAERKTQSSRVVSPQVARTISPGRASEDSDGVALQQARSEALANARAEEAREKAAAVPTMTMSTLQKRAKLLYEQVAQTESEISVPVGEIVTVVTDDNDDWWLVRYGDVEGYIPANYMEALPPSPVASPRVAVASPRSPLASPVSSHTNGAVAVASLNASSRNLATSVALATTTADGRSSNTGKPAEPKGPKTPEEHRILIAEEIVATERSYFQSLEIIVKFFLQPLRKDGLVSAADVKILFGNVDDIRTIHKTVLETLEKGAAEHLIAPGFQHMIKYLTLYTAYCKNHSAAAARYHELEKNSKMTAFMVKQKEAAGRGLDLPSLLIMPVQRVPRYRLLFAELLKYTPADHPELKDLNECYAHILKIADALNEGMRIADQQEKLAQLQKSFIGSCPPLVKLGRVLVKEGTLKKVCRKGTKDRYFFLFNDLLLYGLRLPTGSYTCHAASPIENVSITDVTDTTAQQNAFSILATPKSFTVVADSAEDKSTWMAAINKAIAADPRAAQKAKAPVWLPDNDAPQCSMCRSAFSLLHRRHHCRNCGGVVCSNCSKHEFKMDFSGKNERVCDRCYEMLYQEWRTGSARSRQSVYVSKTATGSK